MSSNPAIHLRLYFVFVLCRWKQSSGLYRPGTTLLFFSKLRPLSRRIGRWREVREERETQREGAWEGREAPVAGLLFSLLHSLIKGPLSRVDMAGTTPSQWVSRTVCLICCSPKRFAASMIWSSRPYEWISKSYKFKTQREHYAHAHIYNQLLEVNTYPFYAHLITVTVTFSWSEKLSISRDLLKQRHIKNQERFITSRRFGVIMTPLSRD